ncbi:hypothetical protein ACOSP7_009021 [Xanthoceras sorbifolium]
MELSLIPSSSSSSSSSIIPQFKYDVFLSFRGEDTRNNFTSHLYKALRDKQIETFIDYNINRGDEISQSLLKAIEESHISVVIFSKDYASSRWCLNELVKILECREKYKQIVMPVFYEVEPSDVRNQSGSFADAFAEHELRFKESLDKLQTWKDALKKAANLSGWHSDNKKSKSVLIEDIVEDVLKRLNGMPSSDKKNLVGIDSSIMLIEWLLEPKEVRRVGIWGIGGIGKTTLAEAVFNKISHKFEGSYFVHSVREASEQSGGLKRLQQGLISTLLGDANAYIGTFTMKRLGRKKLLIIFDDVTDLRQIEYLIRDLDYLSSTSRIIITSRNKQVLKTCTVGHIYEVRELYFRDALNLFCRYAFGQNHPKVHYKEMSIGVVKHVGGVPLALKVLGSSLLDKRKEVWESAMKKLENNFDKNIHEVMKISYDGIDDNEQSMFLDIVCFFKGWDVNLVKAFMDASGFFAEIGISALIDKSLITISYNKLITIHDLLQAMGKEIVRQESINDPGKRSRLWHHKDIYHVLTTGTGTGTIVGISLNMSTTKDIQLHPRAFVKMQKLRFLRFYISDYRENSNNKNKVHVSQDGFECFFTELSYLHWYGCPLKSLQSNFHSENLVILEMPNSTLEELWSDVLQLDNLKSINLKGSQHLIRCPDLSGAGNLESLMLGDCTSLSEIPSSIQHLNKLKSMYLDGCKSLASIPDCTGLRSLEELFLDNSSKLKILPELPNSLKTLSLSGCKSLVEIPSSLKHLNKLESLIFTGCESLPSIPDCRGLKALKQALFSKCSKLKRFPGLPNNFNTLDLSGCSSLFELSPSFEDLSRLVYLDLSDCSELKRLPNSFCKWKSLHTLCLFNCSKIDKFPDDIGTLESLTQINARGTAIREVPSSISCLKSLYSLSISRFEGDDGVEGLLLPALLGLHNLRYLYLSDCGITEIPDSLGCLTSLETLFLDSNNFESIPPSIINLSKLSFLDISYCKRLKVLPKLRYWTCIDAVNCTSLEDLSCPSFHTDIFLLGSQIMVANFINCFNLDRNSLNGFVKDTLLKIQALAALVNKVYLQFCAGPRPISICYPESEIPKWFTFQSRGSFIDVKLPLNWFNNNILSFALCVVVAIPDHQCDHHGDYYGKYANVVYECNVKSKEGHGRVESNAFGSLYSSFGKPYSLFRVPYPGPHCIRSNHVIIGFGYHFFRNLCDNQFSFRFYVQDENELNIEYCKVEKCGVHLMFGQDLEKSDESKEEDEPHPEESNEEDEPYLEESDEEDEPYLEESDEEDEPYPKKPKIKFPSEIAKEVAPKPE